MFKRERCFAERRFGRGRGEPAPCQHRLSRGRYGFRLKRSRRDAPSLSEDLDDPNGEGFPIEIAGHISRRRDFARHLLISCDQEILPRQRGGEVAARFIGLQAA